MQLDFHYYAAYCAAYLVGYTHEECLEIAYADQFVDCCSATLLKKVGADPLAATTQLQLEMMDTRTDFIGLRDITRIWASFHFLPYDLRAVCKHGLRAYQNKYRMICNANSHLLPKTIKLAKGSSLQATGLAMHVLCDTWAHRYFAGTPSLVINDTNYFFYEIFPPEEPEGEETEKQVRFRHSPTKPDDPQQSIYTNSVPINTERSIMNLGHGRAGHLPDYSYIKYRYLPAWGGYEEIVKDNPSDYMHAFRQMVYALKCLRSEDAVFETEKYDRETVDPYAEEIDRILRVRRTDASADWKALGERLSGQEIPDFDFDRYQKEYMAADPASRSETAFGKFITAALKQKSMVTDAVYQTGNLLMGFPMGSRRKLTDAVRMLAQSEKEWRKEK